MKFIKVTKQQPRFFNLVNLANIDYINVDKELGTCQIFFSNGRCLNCEGLHSKAVLDQVSEYNRQVIEHLTTSDIQEDNF